MYKIIKSIYLDTVYPFSLVGRSLRHIDSAKCLAKESLSETRRFYRTVFCARRTFALAGGVVGTFAAPPVVVAVATETFAAREASQSYHSLAQNHRQVQHFSPIHTSLDIQILDSSLLPLNLHYSSQNILSPRGFASTRTCTKRQSL